MLNSFSFKCKSVAQIELSSLIQIHIKQMWPTTRQRLKKRWRSDGDCGQRQYVMTHTRVGANQKFGDNRRCEKPARLNQTIKALTYFRKYEHDSCLQIVGETLVLWTPVWISGQGGGLEEGGAVWSSLDWRATFYHRGRSRGKGKGRTAWWRLDESNREACEGDDTAVVLGDELRRLFSELWPCYYRRRCPF